MSGDPPPHCNASDTKSITAGSTQDSSAYLQAKLLDADWRAKAKTKKLVAGDDDSSTAPDAQLGAAMSTCIQAARAMGPSGQ